MRLTTSSRRSAVGSGIEVMSDNMRFRAAKAKLAWAEAQMQIVEREIAELLEENEQSIINQMRPNESGIAPLVFDRVDVPDVLAVHIGRIVGSLKSALDNLAVEAVLEIDPKADTRCVVFPFSGNPERAGCDKWFAGKVGPMKDAHRGIIVDAQTYQGGNPILLAMKELRDADEHLAIRIGSTMKRVGTITMSSRLRTEIVTKADGSFEIRPVHTRDEPKRGAVIKIEFSEPLSAGRDVASRTREMISETAKIIAAFDDV